jgi:tetratricopeptide (TPR) repeat protein
MTDRNKIRIVAILLLTTLLFFQVIHFEFVHWDDNYFVVENALLRMPFLDVVQRAFGHFFAGDYLPLTLMSLWTDFQLAGGAEPQWFHAVNLALHLANVYLLWLCLDLIFENKRIVFFSCLVFAIHPLQVESVAWVSERKGLLCALFSLAALFTALKSSRMTLIVYPLFFGLGLLCKASTVFLPLFIFVYDFKIRHLNLRDTIRRNSIALLLACVFIFVRITAYSEATDQLANYSLSIERCLHIPFQILSALGFYILKFIWPFDLAIIYPAYEVDFDWLLDMAAGLTFIVAIIWEFRRTNRWTATAMSALWFFLMLLPVLQIVPRLNFVNERYAYLAVPGLAIWFVVWLEKIHDLKIKIAVIALFTVFFMVRTELRLPVWSSDWDLWQQTVKARPWSGISHLNLGSIYEKRGLFHEAQSEYELATLASPEQDTRAQGYSNILSLYSNRAYPEIYNLEEAEKNMNLALDQRIDESSKLKLTYNLLRLKMLEGNTTAARQMAGDLLKTLESHPDPRFFELKNLTSEILRQLPAN